MNSEQATFFDAQVDAPWANTPYGPDERPKLDRLFAHCGPLRGQIVLEPGCGTGRLTELLVRAVGPSGFVHACDISAMMARRAQERTRGLVQVRVRHAAMESLHLDEKSVDLIICHQVFPHFSNQRQALRHMASLLKPAGTLIIVHFECSAHINDVHRKAGTVVQNDRIPDQKKMERLLNGVGMRIRFFSDDPHLGYLLVCSGMD